MDNFLYVLLIVAIVVTVITVLGHGFWLIVAALMRWFFGSGEPPAESQRCPACTHPTGLVNGLCHACAHQTASAIQRDLPAAKRQLNRLEQNGQISRAEHASLMQAISVDPYDPIPSVCSTLAAPQSDIAEPSTSAPLQTGTESTSPSVTDPPSAAIASQQDTAHDSSAHRQAVTPFSESDSESDSEAPIEAQVIDEPDKLFGPDELDDASSAGERFSPRRTLADMLQAFMEEKNIRWGELASGMLIVGSAIGLIISLRATLEKLADAVPYFPALMLMLGTAAIHGVGLYTLRRWHLRATSRGVLIIATLLIPLSFSAGIVLSGSGPNRVPVTSVWYISAVLIGLIGYGTITAFSARALSSEGWWRLVVAVMGTSAGQLVINRLSAAETDWPPVWTATGLFALPLLSYLIATTAQLSAVSQRERLTPVRAAQTFLLFGLAIFSLAVPFGLLLWTSGQIRPTITALSPSLSIVAAAMTGIGIAVHRRCTSRVMTGTRTIGTALALLGGMAMAAVFVLAWPNPAMLVTVGLVTAAILTALAVAGRLPLLYAGAFGSASLAILVLFHWTQGRFDPIAETTGRQMVEALLMGRSALALSLIALLVGATAACLAFGKRLSEAGISFAAAIALAVVSFVIALYAGFWSGTDCDWTTLLFIGYAIAAFVVTANWRRASFDRLTESVRAELALVVRKFESADPAGFGRTAHELFGWLTSGLLAISLIHLLGLNGWFFDQLKSLDLAIDRPVLVAILVHGLLVALIGVGLFLWRHRSISELVSANELPVESKPLLRPFGVSGALSATLATPLSLFVTDSLFAHHAVYLTCIAFTWLLASWVTRVRLLQTLSHIAATVTVAFVAAAVAQWQAWSEAPLKDLRHWQLQLSALGLWCAASAAFRLVMQPSPTRPGQQASKQPPSIDELLLGVLVSGLVVIGLVGCYPGACVETGSIAVTSSLATDTWHQVAYGPGSWIALGCIALALIVSAIERRSSAKWIGLCTATLAVPLLVSGSFESQQAVTSALRWSCSIFALVWSVALAVDRPLARVFGWHWLRQCVDRPARPTAGNEAIEAQSGFRGLSTLRGLAAAFGIVPVVGLTSWSLVQVANGATPGGPLADSFFGQMAPALSYGLPFGLLIVGLLICATRDRQPSHAFAGTFLLQYLITIAVALPTLTSGGNWTPQVTVSLVQWSAIALPVYAWVWLLLSRWIEPRDSTNGSLQLQLHLLLSTAATLGLAGRAFAWMFVEPNLADSVAASLGTWPSYVAAILAIAAIAWHIRRVPTAYVHLLVGSAVVLVTLFSATAIGGNSIQPWISYHILTAGWLAVGIAVTVFSWRQTYQPGQATIAGATIAGATIAGATIAGATIAGATTAGATTAVTLARWSTGLTIVAACLVLRGCDSDPLDPWWTLGLWTGLTALIAALGIRGRNQHYAFATIPMAMFAATFACIQFTRGWATELLYWNVIGVSATAGFWLLVEIWFQDKKNESFDVRTKLPSVHAIVAGITIIIMLVVVVGGAVAVTLSRLHRGVLTGMSVDWYGIAAVSGLGVLLLATLWDRRAKRVGLVLYSWGIIAIAMALNTLENVGPLGTDGTIVGACLALATYVALTSHLWKWGANLTQLAGQLRIPEPVAKLESVSYWLPSFNFLGTAIICLLGLAIVLLGDERWMRMSTAFAPLMAAYGVSCFAQPPRKLTVQCISLIVASLAAVFMGWADIDATSSGDLTLLYAARLLIVLTGLTLLFGVVIARWISSSGEWYSAVRRSAFLLAVAAAVSLVALMVIEVMTFRAGIGTPLGTAEVIVISVMLAGFVATLLTMAVLPGKDPFALTESGRSGYVYAAQAVAALLFAHIYLAKPELFSDLMRPYWPYIVMSIAFASVAVGEICRRQGWTVIAEPMQRTGGFLPLLPALGTWVFAHQGNHSLTLFFAGLIYVFLSISRRSFLASVAAAVAGNGALWALLYENGYVLTAVPQFWLIPPAASMLIAAQINRNRLDEGSMTAIRYISIMIIYLSSTGEMFMKMLTPDGPGGMLRPMILASLAVAGLMLGIMLRIRAFLYLGASFLLLSIFAMVWQAARVLDHTWPWWAFGITLGLLILVVFGIFEKHRPEVLRLVERLRQWQP